MSLELASFALTFLGVLVGIVALLPDGGNSALRRRIAAISFIVAIGFFILGVMTVWNDENPVSSLPIPQPGPTVTENTPVIAEATATDLLIPDFQTVSLQTVSELSTPEINLGLEPGPQTLADIPFETGWKATTQCSHLRDRPTTIRRDTNISSPTEVYLLLQAGWGLEGFDNQEIANVRLGFDSGDEVQLPLILGSNIRDWSRGDNAVTTASSPTLQLAWEGTDEGTGTRGGMDILTIEIPDEHRSSILTYIELEDTTLVTTGDINPCVHLLAITIKYLR